MAEKSNGHSPAPWKLALAGNQWGLSAKGSKPKDGEPDLAMGSTYAERWREDVALIRAAPKMLTTLDKVEAFLVDKLRESSDPELLKEVRAVIRAARKPVEG